MADIIAKWLEGLTVTFDDTSPAKTVEGKGPIDLEANDYIRVYPLVEITWGASGDGDAEIRVRHSPDSGTHLDTIPLFSQRVAFTAGATKRISIGALEGSYFQIGVYNGNTAVEDITIACIYSALQFQTA